MKKTNQLITVVIRTMPGRENFLEKCLFILQGQTYLHIEVLVIAQLLIDDTGIETLEAIINRWSNNFDSLKLITHVSGTDARARSLNIGIRNASGRYLSFLDDDDKVYTHHYTKLIESLQKTAYGWAYADVIRAVYNEHGQLISRSDSFHRPAYSYLDHVRGNFIPIHSFVIDRERVLDIGEVDEQMSRLEDYDFILRLAYKYEPLYVPVFSAEYCIRNDGSNSVVDGICNTKDLVMKNRLWNDARSILDEKKVLNIGWWIREINSLPEIYPAPPPSLGKKSSVNRDFINPFSSFGNYFRDRLHVYYESTSWGIIKTIRNLVFRLICKLPPKNVYPKSEIEAMYAVQKLLKSVPWKLTMPFRLIAQWAESKQP